MKQKYVLQGPHLWTRDVARPLRAEIEGYLQRLEPGDVLVVDASAVEVFDYSFAAELFGKTILALPHDHPGRFFAVEHLTEYARENLVTTLDRLELAMIELRAGQPQLLGKTHSVDVETFAIIAASDQPLAAAELRDKLGLTVNAVNERLTKLANLGLIRRERGRSPAGRELFLYRTLS